MKLIGKYQTKNENESNIIKRNKLKKIIFFKRNTK